MGSHWETFTDLYVIGGRRPVTRLARDPGFGAFGSSFALLGEIASVELDDEATAGTDVSDAGAGTVAPSADGAASGAAGADAIVV
jgi:hypothetical protein